MYYFISSNEEYNLEVKLERLPLTVARWPKYKADAPGQKAGAPPES